MFGNFVAKKDLLAFDFDGTLFNTLGDLTIAVNFALREFSLKEHSQEKIKTFIGNGSLKLIERAVAASEKNDLVKVENVHQVFSEFYWEHCTDKTFFNPFIEKFLTETSVPVAILTNKPEYPTKKILKHFGLENRFQFVLCGDTAPEKKPSAKGLLKIIEESRINKENVVMIGDDEPDILASQNADVDCITLLCGFGKSENLLPLCPQNVVKSYKELYSILNQIIDNAYKKID